MRYQSTAKGQGRSTPPPLITYELLDLGAPPSPCEHAIDEQQYHGPDEPRHDRRYPLSGANASAEADGSEEPTPHDGPHDADDDRHYYSARVIPRHDQLR